MREPTADELIHNLYETHAHALALLVAAIANQLDAHQLAHDLRVNISSFESQAHPNPAVRIVLQDSISAALLAAKRQPPPSARH